MNAKMIAAGISLLAGLGAAVPAHADSFRIGVRDRHFGVGISIGHPRYVAPAPVYVEPEPVYVAPRYVAPAPVVVEEPVYVDGGYYLYEHGHRVFYRGRYHRYHRW